jgi:hypothetical protein
MWFLLRMTLWLGVVLVLLPSGGSRPVPKSQVSTSEVFSAAKVVLGDIQHFCERQPEACVVGSQATVTLGQRAQAGAKILYEFLSVQFGSEETGPLRITGSLPIPTKRPSQHTLRPADFVPPWRGPQPSDTLRDKRAGTGLPPVVVSTGGQRP